MLERTASRADGLLTGTIIGHLGHVVRVMVVRPRVDVFVVAAGASWTLGLFLDVPDVAALLQPVLTEAERAGAAFLQLGAPLTVELLDLGEAVVAVVQLQASWQGFQINHRPVPDVLAVEVDAVVLVDGLATGDCG